MAETSVQPGAGRARSVGALGRAMRSIVSWLDCETVAEQYRRSDRPTGVDWARVVPFILLHGSVFALPWVGWSWIAVAVAVGFLFARVFFLTAFYHRYFSHKAFETSRAMQFVFAVLGNTAAQRGALWWASHHRNHHAVSDREGDPHSPHRHSLYWSHMGWITSRENFATDYDRIPDLARYPELRWLDRFDTVVPVATAGLLFGLGAALERWAPGLGTSGWQMLVWGFFLSTVVLFHVTCLVNSGAHLIGRRRFSTRDQSRNSLIIALLTFGEGWHNNHHFYPAAARQGFYWWQIDITYYLLRLLSWFRIVRDLKPVPERVLIQGRGAPVRAR